MTWTQVQLPFKDNNGAVDPLICFTDGTNFAFAHVLLDNTGAIVAPASAGNQGTMITSLAAIATACAAATPAGTNLIGSVSEAANTSGGVSTYAATGGTGNALLGTTPVAVKSGATNLYGVNFVNTGNSDVYVQLFNATSITLGTTVPKMVFCVPANGSWEEKFTGEAKVSFATGLMVAATTTATGSTAPVIGVFGNILFK